MLFLKLECHPCFQGLDSSLVPQASPLHVHKGPADPPRRLLAGFRLADAFLPEKSGTKQNRESSARLLLGFDIRTLGSELPIPPCLVILVLNRTSEPSVALASSCCGGLWPSPTRSPFPTGAPAPIPAKLSGSLWEAERSGKSMGVLRGPPPPRETISLVNHLGNHLHLDHSPSGTYQGSDAENTS